MNCQKAGTVCGVNVEARREKIRRAHRLEPIASVDDVPVCVPIPTFFAIGSTDKPADYFRSVQAFVEYQEAGARWHLEHLIDDHVPFIMPWHGTGIIPSMFGGKVHYPPGVNDDPAIREPCIRSVHDIARLRAPDPHKDGLMPWVLDVMHYAKEHTEIPVVLTDMQSTLGCAGWMCGQTNLCIWMIEEPQAVKDLFQIVTDAIIASVRAQKEVVGDALDESQGLQGVWAPEGVGIWLSDDDAVMQSPDLYEEFCVPEVSRIFTAFGKGILHYCGDNQNKVDRFKKIENLAAINTSCMGNFQLIRSLQESFGGKLPIIMQENAPIDVPFYFDRLFTEVGTMRGIIICQWATATVAMKRNGAATSGRWEPLTVGREIVARVRRNTERMLSDQPILEKQYPILPEDEAIHAPAGHCEQTV